MIVRLNKGDKLPDRRKMYWEDENYTHRLARWCKRCKRCKKLKCRCETPERCDNRFIPKTSYQLVCSDCYKDSVKEITEKRVSRQQIKEVEA